MLGRAQTYRPGIWARMFGGGAWKLALDSRHDARMMLGGDEIACLDITAIDTSKALLWHTVEIRTSSRIEALTGLTGNALDVFGTTCSHS